MTAVVAVPASTPLTATRPQEGARVGWLQAARVLLLVLLPCACYWPAMRGEFLWDDDLLITRNPLLGSWEGLREIWFSTRPLDYFPLTNTSFWLEWSLWGTNSTGYHVVNLVLHVVSAFVFWRLLSALRLPGAWFGALLFAIHPINAASVGWIAERKNVLSMVFYLGSLLCFVRWRERTGVPGAWRSYLLSLGWYVLAALSKSSVVMLPCLLLLLTWWQDGRLRWRDFLRTAPFFAVSLAAGLLTMWFQYHRAMGAAGLAHARPLALRMLAAGQAIPFYLGKVVFPYPLAMLYPRWQLDLRNPVCYLAPLGLAALLAVGWWARRFWGRGPLVALGSFVLMVLPVSGLLPMSFFGYSDVSDHLVYVAVPGLFALAAAGLSWWYRTGGGWIQRATLVAMTLVVGTLSLACEQRAEEFGSAERLWRGTLEISPRAFAALNNLGLIYQERAHRDPRQLLVAEHYFRAALASEYQLRSAGINLANVLRMESHWAESADLYRQVLAVDPEAETYNNYGVTLLELGDDPKAREAFYHALRLDPSMVSAYYNLYGIEQAEHRLPQAFAALRACLRVDPQHVPSLVAMVMLNLDQAGQPPPPAAAELLVATAERACQLTQYHQAQSLVALAKSLAAAGRPAEADKMAARAAETASANGQTDLVTAIADYRRSLGR